VSSLPPYNPPHSQRIAWLLHQDGAGAGIVAAGATMRDLTAAWIVREEDRERLGGAVTADAWFRVDPGGAVAVIADEIRAIRGSALVVADPKTLDRLLRDLIELPPTRASFRFIPGLATTVQLLPDRAVLRHLNQGGALTL
jgi:hypothetical protein